MKSSEIQFGNVIFDRASKGLSEVGGASIELRHQTLRVLELLASRPGEMITKEAFNSAIWDGASVSDESLAKCIAEIRKAIGDNAKRVIETVPRKGYRLVAKPKRSARFRVGSIATAAMLFIGIGVAAVTIWLQVPRNLDPPVVAVLPFADLSPAPHRGYLSDAVSEGIIVDLAKFPELTVIAESASFRFRDQAWGVSEAADALGADFILDGSQQFDGEALRVTARLIDTRTGASVWTDSTDSTVGAIFSVNRDISTRVANAIVEKVADVGARTPEGYGAEAMLLFFKARQLTKGQLSRERLDEAIALNTRVVEAHPDEPWGHIGLAFNLRTKVRFGWTVDPASDILAQAERHALLAVELSPVNYAGHFALGRVLMQRGELSRAIAALEKSVELNPSSASAYNALAQPLFYLGRSDEALKVLERSEAIDPLGNFVHHWMKAWALWQAGRCDEALNSLEKIASLPTDAHKLLAVVQVCRGDKNSAKIALAAFLSENPDWAVAREAELHRATWKDKSSMDRWLSDLGEAGLPSP